MSALATWWIIFSIGRGAAFWPLPFQSKAECLAAAKSIESQIDAQSGWLDASPYGGRCVQVKP